MKENKEHFDMSDMVRADLKDNTNKKVVCKQKDEFHGHVPTTFTSLNPKVYSSKHQVIDEQNQKIIKERKHARAFQSQWLRKKLPMQITSMY
jgi:hypothetical protein